MTQTGHVAESFRQLALSVRAALDDAKASSLLVTSAMPGEGKTFTACNLALALESLEPGGQIALVEFDLRRPAMASVFGLEASPGMEAVLAGEQTLDAAVVRTDASLDLYPVGRHVRDVHKLLAGDLLYGLLDELEQRYQIVVCDSPPALLVPDVKLLARRIGGVLAVARARYTAKSAFQALSDFLPRDKLLGCFLNDARPSRRDRYYASAYYEPPEATAGAPEGDPR